MAALTSDAVILVFLLADLLIIGKSVSSFLYTLIPRLKTITQLFIFFVFFYLINSGYAPRGLRELLEWWKRREVQYFFVFLFYGRFLLRGWWYPPTKQLKTFPGTMKRCIVKKHHIGSMVGEILWYRHTQILVFYILILAAVHKPRGKQHFTLLKLSWKSKPCSNMAITLFKKIQST